MAVSLGSQFEGRPQQQNQNLNSEKSSSSEGEPKKQDGVERTSLSNILKSAFSHPGFFLDKNANEEMRKDYAKYLETYAQNLPPEKVKGVKCLAKVLESGADPEKRYHLMKLGADLKRMLLIDHNKNKIYLVDISSDTRSLSFSFKSHHADPLKETAIVEDRYTQLFREYSNLTSDQLENIKKICGCEFSGAEYVNVLESYLNRSADKFRSPVDEPEMFFKNKKDVPFVGDFFEKALNVVSQIIMNDSAPSLAEAKAERKRIKLLWKLDLLKRNMADIEGEDGKSFQDDWEFLENSISLMARSATKLLDEKGISEKESKEIIDYLQGIQQKIEGYQKEDEKESKFLHGKSNDLASNESITISRESYLGEGYFDFSKKDKSGIDDQQNQSPVIPQKTPDSILGFRKQLENLKESLKKEDGSAIVDNLNTTIQRLLFSKGMLSSEDFMNLVMETLLALPTPTRANSKIGWNCLKPDERKECAKLFTAVMGQLKGFFAEDLPRGAIAHIILSALAYHNASRYYKFSKKQKPATDDLIKLLQWGLLSVKRGDEHQAMWASCRYLLPEISPEFLLTKQEKVEGTVYGRSDFEFDIKTGSVPALDFFNTYTLPKLEKAHKELILEKLVPQEFIDLEKEASNSYCFVPLLKLRYEQFVKNYSGFYGKENVVDKPLEDLFRKYKSTEESLDSCTDEQRKTKTKIDEKTSNSRKLQEQIKIEEDKKKEYNAERALIEYKSGTSKASKEKIEKLDRLILESEKLFEEYKQDLSKLIKELDELKVEEKKLADRKNELEKKLNLLKNEISLKVTNYVKETREKLTKEVTLESIIKRVVDAKNQQNMKYLAEVLFLKCSDVDPISSSLLTSTTKLSEYLYGRLIKPYDPLPKELDKSLAEVPREFGYDFDYYKLEGGTFTSAKEKGTNLENNRTNSWDRDIDRRAKYLRNARINPYQALENLCGLLKECDVKSKILKMKLFLFRKVIFSPGALLYAENVEQSIPELLGTTKSFINEFFKQPSNRKDDVFELYSLLHDIMDHLHSSGKIDRKTQQNYLNKIDTDFADAIITSAYDDETEKYNEQKIQDLFYDLCQVSLKKITPKPSSVHYEQKRMLKLAVGEQLARHFSKGRVGSQGGYASKAICYVNFEAFTDQEISNLLNPFVLPFMKNSKIETQNIEWKNNSHFLVSEKLNLKVNKVTGEVTPLRGSGHLLPQLITSDPIFQQAFDQSDLIIEYKRGFGFDSGYYKISHPTKEIALIYDYDTYRGATIMSIMMETKEGQRYEALSEKDIKLIKAMIPSLKNKGEKLSFWRRRSEGLGENDDNLVIFDGLTKVLMEGRSENNVIQEFKKKGEEDKVIVPQAHYRHPFSALSGKKLVEQGSDEDVLECHLVNNWAEKVECWAEKLEGKHQLRKVELPESLFSFDVNDEGVYSWALNKEFSICEEKKGELPEFLRIQAHVVLKDEKGNRKILILEGDKPDVTEIDIVDGHLIPKERMTVLKLAEGYLRQNQPTEAIKFLSDRRVSGFNTSSSAFTEGEINILNSLIEDRKLQQLAAVDSRYATALLRAFYILSRSEKIQPGSSKLKTTLNSFSQDEFSEMVNPLFWYSRYSRSQQQISKAGFDESEIKFLANVLGEQLKVVKKGIHDLLGKQLPINTKSFVGKTLKKLYESDFVKNQIFSLIEIEVDKLANLSLGTQKAIKKGKMSCGNKVTELDFVTSSIYALIPFIYSLFSGSSEPFKEEKIMKEFAKYIESPETVDLKGELSNPKKPGEFFGKHYFPLYKIAKEGTRQEKEHLRVLLSASFPKNKMDEVSILEIFTRKSSTSTPTVEVITLYDILDNPGRYPSISTVKDALLNYQKVDKEVSSKKDRCTSIINDCESSKQAIINELKAYKSVREIKRKVKILESQHEKKVRELKLTKIRLAQVNRKLSTVHTSRLKNSYNDKQQWLDKTCKSQEMDEKTLSDELKELNKQLESINQVVDQFNTKHKKSWSSEDFLSRVAREHKRQLKIMENLEDHLSAAKNAFLDKLIYKKGLFSKILWIVGMIVSLVGDIFKKYIGTFGYFTKKKLKSLTGRVKPVISFSKNSSKIYEKTADRLKALSRYDSTLDRYFQDLESKYFVLDDSAKESTKCHISKTNLERKLTRTEFNAIEEKVDQYNAYHESKDENSYKLKDGKKLTELEKDIKKRRASLELEVGLVKSSIVSTLEFHTQLREKLRLFSEGEKLNFEWLVEAVKQKSPEEIMKDLGMTQKATEELLIAIGKYLVLNTRVAQFNFIEGMISQNRSVQEVRNSLLQMKRSYSVFENGKQDFSKLWFELSKNFLIRHEQMEVIAKISGASKSSEKIIEAGTGFGKTSTVVPVSARLIAETTGKLTILSWPGSLVDENANDITVTFDNAFGTKSSRMHFERSSELNSKTLKFIYNDLLAHKKQCAPVNLTGDALRSFMLHYRFVLDKLYKAKKCKSENVSELQKQVKYFTKTLNLFKNDSVIFIDESHATLDPVDRLIYSIGKEERLPDSLIKNFEKVMIDFFKIKAKNGKTVEEMLSSGKSEGVKDEIQFIKEKCIDKLITDLVISDKYTDRIRSFIRKGTPDPFSGKNPIQLNEETKELVCLYKGLFSDGIFEEAACMSHNEQYGLSHKHLKDFSFAIPYSAAQVPSESVKGPSQFANPHKTLMLTYLSYFNKGLRGSGDSVDDYQIYSFMQHLLKDAKEERLIFESMNQKKSIRDTTAYKFFAKHAPENYRDVLTPIGLESLRVDDIREIHKEMSKKSEVILKFLAEVTLKQIKVYPESIDCTFANFLSMFENTVSMSATPMDPKSYRMDATFYGSKNTSEKAIEKMLLHSLSGEEPIDTIKGGSSVEVLEQVGEVIKKTDNCSALIDLAGLLKDVDNFQVASSLNNEIGDQFDQVTYYDQKKGFVKINKSSVIPQKDNVQKLCKRFPYYDQPRAVGSDVKFANDGVLVVLVKPETPITKVAQAVGRARQLGSDQKVLFVIPENSLKDTKLTKEEVIALWLLELDRLEASRNTMSIQQQVDDILQSALQETLLNLPIERKDLFYHRNRKFFVTTNDISARNLYGSESSLKSGIKVILDQIESKIAQIRSLRGMSRLSKARVRNKLEVAKKELIKIKLQQEIRVGAKSSGTFQAQQKMETQTKGEIQLQIENQSKVNIEIDSGTFDYLHWDPSISLRECFISSEKGGISKKRPYRRISSVLSNSKRKILQNVKGMFDDNLLVSANFWHEGQVIYGSKQKPFHSCLIQMDEKNGKKSFTLTIVDETEARGIESRFRKKQLGNGAAKVALYNIATGVVVGKEEFTNKDWNHPSLLSLFSQVKLLSGHFGVELSSSESNAFRNNPFLLKKESKNHLVNFLRGIVHRDEDLTTIENSRQRVKKTLPKILQVLGLGRTVEELLKG